MPSTNNQALLLDLQVFLANNNIRRGILNVAVNASAPGNQCIEQSLDVPINNGVRTFTSVANNSCTVIRTSKPVTAILTKGADTFTFNLKSLLVFPDTVDTIQFTNTSLVDVATLRIVQI